jgi:ComF family protein
VGFTTRLVGLANGMLNLVFPPRCVACGAWGDWFCATCLATVRPISNPCCSHCGRPLIREGCCTRCRESNSHLESIRSSSTYRRPLSHVIHALKYNGIRVLAEPLADIMWATWQSYSTQCDLIVPVPLHPKRVRERGYNQSALLARALGQRVGIRMANNVICRVRNTKPQVGLSRPERLQNMAGAFVSQHKLTGSPRILLIDDVCTTGATLEACAKVLLQTGAGSVHALTLARAIGRYGTSAQPQGERI